MKNPELLVLKEANHLFFGYTSYFRVTVDGVETIYRLTGQASVSVPTPSALLSNAHC